MRIRWELHRFYLSCAAISTVAILCWANVGSAEADILLNKLWGITSLPRTKNPSASRQVSIVYAPWTKVCSSDRTKDLCLTVKEAYLKTGEFFGSAALIEAKGETKKKLRVVLPLGVILARGTRMLIDEGTPASGPFTVCFPNGCMAEYELTADMIFKLRNYQKIFLEAFDGIREKPIYLVFPLTDFINADAGGSISPEEFQERRRVFGDNLKRKSSQDAR